MQKIKRKLKIMGTVLHLVGMMILLSCHMKIMGTVIRLIALMILLSCHSCRTLPDPARSLVVEQCGLTFHIDSNGKIDEQLSKCECRQYEYSLDYMGGVAGTTTKNPLQYCQKLIGNKPKEYLSLTNFLGDVRKDIQSNLP